MRPELRSTDSQSGVFSLTRSRQQAAKPKFLLDLELYLERELALCGDHADRRLQLFSEVFDRFIDDCTAYKPLLSAIRAEFDRHMSALRADAVRLRDVETQAALAERAHEVAVAELVAAQRRELYQLTDANRIVRARVVDLDEQVRQLHAAKNTLARELAETGRQLQDESAARRMLLAQFAANSTVIAVDDSAEVARLRGELEAAHAAAAAARAQAASMVAADRHAAAQQTIERLQHALAAVRRDMAGIAEEHSAYAALCKEAIDSRAAMQQKLNAAKAELAATSATPPTVDGPIFPGQGIRLAVPVHLRAAGPVRDRQCSAADLRVLARDLMQERLAAAPQLGSSTPPLAAFVWERLARQFSPEKATEWAYNLQFGCERAASEDDLVLFAAALAGRSDELLWRQAELLHTMLNAQCEGAPPSSVEKALKLLEGLVGRRDPAPLRIAEALVAAARADAWTGLGPVRREVYRWILAAAAKQMGGIATRVRERLASSAAHVSALDLAAAVEYIVPDTPLPSLSHILLWVFDPILVTEADRTELVQAVPARSPVLAQFLQPADAVVDRLLKTCTFFTV